MNGEQTQKEVITTEHKLDPELKAKWLEALRGGKYHQAREVLRDQNNCFCCLGVLANIIDPTAWSPSLSDCEEADKPCYSYMNGMETMIGGSVRELIGLSETAAIALAGKNDDGESFAQIADFIEANL